MWIAKWGGLRLTAKDECEQIAEEYLVKIDDGWRAMQIIQWNVDKNLTWADHEHLQIKNVKGKEDTCSVDRSAKKMFATTKIMI